MRCSFRAKLTMMATSFSIVTIQLFVPLQYPLQLSNWESSFGTAVNDIDYSALETIEEIFETIETIVDAQV